MNFTLVVACAAVCLVALVLTFYLGATQSGRQNKTYENNRRKIVVFLSVLYVIAMIVGALLIPIFQDWGQ